MSTYKKIKLTFPYPEWPILRQTPASSGCWKSYQFYINPGPKQSLDFDYWVVFNFPLVDKESTRCRKGNTILITGEPESIDPYSNRYVNQFDHLITANQTLQHPRKFLMPQGLPWYVDKSYDALVAIHDVPKSKKISIISSSKTRSEGHRQRLDFVTKLKAYFGDDIDLYGRGINDFEDKWQTLAPYQYSVTIENSSQPYYFTEKIMDCYLSMTFPLYFGCTNIDEYFDPKSVGRIDINNFENSVKAIKEILNDDTHYNRSVDSLRASREKVLSCYNLFPLIVNFIEEQLKSEGKMQNRSIRHLHYPGSLVSRLLRKVKQTL